MAIASFTPAGPLRGEVRVPGDKSISHRALILSALADGPSRIRGLATGADVGSTIACLSRLGVAIETGGQGELVVRPPRGGLRPPSGPLDAGNSGTTMRLLAGVMAGQPFWSRLTGDASLRRRPMARIAEPLRWMGAHVVARGSRGGGAGEVAGVEAAGTEAAGVEATAGGAGETAPLDIRGPVPPGPLAARRHDLAVASAQVKSCLLLAGLHAAGRTAVSEPFPSRDHTERMLGVFGVKVAARRGADPGASSPGSAASRGESPVTVTVEGRSYPRLEPADLEVPADFSSAAFWIVAALLVPGSAVRLPWVGVNPTRTGLLAVLGRMGAGDRVRVENLFEPAGGGEPRADVVVRSPGSPATRRGRPAPPAGFLKAVRVSAHEVPALIDEIPILAVAATQARGTTVIEGAGELRVKESDRLAALVSELGRMGALVEAEGDTLIITGPTPLRPARAFAFGDHRMAMALAVAALVASAHRAGRPAAPTEIVGFEAAGVSYPGFHRDLEALLA